MLDDSGPVNRRTGLSPESSAVENDRKEKKKRKSETLDFLLPRSNFKNVLSCFGQTDRRIGASFSRDNFAWPETSGQTRARVIDWPIGSSFTHVITLQRLGRFPH